MDWGQDLPAAHRNIAKKPAPRLGVPTAMAYPIMTRHGTVPPTMARLFNLSETHELQIKLIVPIR